MADKNKNQPKQLQRKLDPSRPELPGEKESIKERMEAEMVVVVVKENKVDMSNPLKPKATGQEFKVKIVGAVAWKNWLKNFPITGYLYIKTEKLPKGFKSFEDWQKEQKELIAKQNAAQSKLEREIENAK